MSNDGLELLEETARWNARDAKYSGGPHERVLAEQPLFGLRYFKVGPDEPPNPHLRSAVRPPRKSVEREMPMGVVLNNYTLAQHSEVAEQCLVGIRRAGVETDGLRCEVGLTNLGEWMNFRIYFPDEYSKKFSDGNKPGLRMKCFNTVAGTHTAAR